MPKEHNFFSTSPHSQCSECGLYRHQLQHYPFCPNSTSTSTQSSFYPESNSLRNNTSSFYPEANSLRNSSNTSSNVGLDPLTSLRPMMSSSSSYASPATLPTTSSRNQYYYDANKAIRNAVFKSTSKKNISSSSQSSRKENETYIIHTLYPPDDMTLPLSPIRMAIGIDNNQIQSGKCKIVIVNCLTSN